MSRSFRHTPIMGIAGNSSSQKKFKQQEHSRERTLVNQRLRTDNPLPESKKFGNEWDSPRDGKMWFGNCKYKSPEPRINWQLEYKKWMRK